MSDVCLLFLIMRSGVFRLIFVRDIHYRFTIEVGNVCLLFEFLCEVWPNLGNMDNDNGLPYESVPPVQIRTEYVHIPNKGLFIYIIIQYFISQFREFNIIRKQRCAIGIPYGI